MMPPDHPLAGRPRVRPKDLALEPFVLFEPQSNTRRAADRLFTEFGIAPRVVLETENVEILKALVSIGMGLTIIPYQAVAHEVRERHAGVRTDHRRRVDARDRLGLPANDADVASRPGTDAALRRRPPDAASRCRTARPNRRRRSSCGRRPTLRADAVVAVLLGAIERGVCRRRAAPSGRRASRPSRRRSETDVAGRFSSSGSVGPDRTARRSRSAIASACAESAPGSRTANSSPP